MDEFKFDELKNFSVPESWLNKALEIPSKKPKAAPKFKFYRYAAAIAACVVIAAAVTLTVMFKSNNDVSLINLEIETTLSDSTFDGENYPYSQSFTDSSGQPKLFFNRDGSSSIIVTEPSENAGGDNSSVTNNKTNSNGSKNTKNKQNTNPANKSKEQNSSPNIAGNTDGVEEQTYKEEQTYNDSESDTKVEDYENYTTELSWLDPDKEYTTKNFDTERSFEFYIEVFKGKVKGDVYCEITDQSGNLISRGLVSKTPSNGKMRASYNVYMKLGFHQIYKVTFYNSNGGVINQRNVYIDERDTYVIYQ